jgi:hypothetical protein
MAYTIALAVYVFAWYYPWAWHTSNWVGGSDPPAEVWLGGLGPCVIGSLAGACAAASGRRGRDLGAYRVATSAGLVPLCLAVHIMFCLAWGAVS